MDEVTNQPLAEKSPIAGQKAVTQVAISRVATALPVLTVPPLVMALVDRLRVVKRYPALGVASNFGTSVSLVLCLSLIQSAFVVHGSFLYLLSFS
jgi:hypothetical protein